MIEVAKSKYPDTQFLEGNAENLEFKNESFDYIIINFGVLHVGDPQKCFQECYRVLKKGGRLFFSLWLPSAESKGMEILYAAVSQFVDTSLIPEGPDFFKYTDKDIALSELSKTGFTEVSSKIVNTHWKIKDPLDFYNAYTKGGARLGSLIDLQSSIVKKNMQKFILSELEKLKEKEL